VTVVYAPPREEVLARLRQVVVAAGLPAEQVNCRVEEGEAAETIIERAQALGADVIALGTHEVDHEDQPRLGPVADSVLRRSRCDVLTVAPRVSTAARHVPGSAIVCGVDFSPHARHALEAAVEFADRVEARVLLVHVIEWATDAHLPADVDLNVSDVRARLVYNAQQRLDALVAAQPFVAGAIRTRVVFGRPHRELLGIAGQEHASLMVLGKHAGRGLSLPFVGSTVELIVRSATCPVLTIHPSEKDAGKEPAGAGDAIG
jgi:nucleotide-binding universal stress UspA family protein